MKVQKSIQLTSKPLQSLLDNGEGIDFRLDEPQWNDIEVGSILEFWEDFSGWDKEHLPSARRVFVEVVGIIRAKKFKELMRHQDLATFLRDDNKEKTLGELRQWWTKKQEQQFGVLGWKVHLISS